MMTEQDDNNINWYRVGDNSLLVEGGITTVHAGHTPVCLSRLEGKYGALNNRCPHQGGPLGDGFLQKGEDVLFVWGASFSNHTRAAANQARAWLKSSVHVASCN